MIVVSVASGTSVDGIDVAAFDFGRDGDVLHATQLLADVIAWPGDLAERALAALPPAAVTIEQVCRLDNDLGRGFATAALRAVERLPHGTRPDLVVCSGQTVFHDVRDGRCEGTLQLGQPAWIAEATGLPVVSDLRSTDVAAGGHGAPLAGILDLLWLQPDEPGQVRGALNLGGIANLSVVGQGSVQAWDTGPANCLIDVAASWATRGAQSYDAGGRLARQGTVSGPLLEVLLAHAYFAEPPPKSTGREVFTAEWLAACVAQVGEADPVDLVATVTELTARTVADAVNGRGLVEVVVAGGGARNPVLTDRLAALAECEITSTETYGVGTDDKESLLWALLGWLRVHGAPIPDGATPALGGRVLGRLSVPAGVTLPAPESLPSRLRT